MKDENIKIVVTNIEWASDDDMVENLPETVEITDQAVIDSYNMLEDIDGYAEGVSDYLSDEYEYCVSVFAAEVVR